MLIRITEKIFCKNYHQRTFGDRTSAKKVDPCLHLSDFAMEIFNVQNHNKQADYKQVRGTRNKNIFKKTTKPKRKQNESKKKKMNRKTQAQVDSSKSLFIKTALSFSVAPSKFLKRSHVPSPELQDFA